MKDANGLTPKQAAFVNEYLVDLNATQSAIRAGYSKKTAYQQGSRLLRNVEVSAAIAKAQEARAKRTGIDQDWVLQSLAALVEVSLSDFLVEVPNSGGLMRYDFSQATPEQMRAIETLQIDTTHAGEGSAVTVDKVKLGLPNRLKTLELIGKHVTVGAFADKTEVSGPNGGPIPVEEMTNTQRARLILEALKVAAELPDG